MNYQLFHGDCLDIMPTLPPQSVDAIIADPPYGTTACAWDSVIPFAPMWECIKRVIKPRGAVVLFGSQPFTSALVMSNLEWFRYEWIWDKHMSLGLAAEYRPLMAHENILVFSCSSHVYNPQMVERSQDELKRLSHETRISESTTEHAKHLKLWSRNRYDGKHKHPSTLVRINALVGTSKEKQSGKHPTQKPVALMSYLIKTYTNPGETVLDFTMGSGSTGVACAETGRNFIGIELDEGYFQIAQERIEMAYRKAQGLPRLGKSTDLDALPLFMEMVS